MYIVGKGLWDKQINMRKHRIKFKCIFRSLVVTIKKKKKKTFKPRLDETWEGSIGRCHHGLWL